MTTTRPAAPTSRSWKLVRLTAPIARVLAGRRFIPLWAVVHHRGRVTGRELSVPVAVRATGDAFVVVLPWGPGTNWARNVLAAGGCVLRWKAVDHRVDEPTLIGRDQARARFSRAQWLMVEKVLRADSFLLLHRSTQGRFAAR